MRTAVQREQVRAEQRFAGWQRCHDWTERWSSYASALGEASPRMAYVRDLQSQLITPVCRNLGG
jgi:hypothetical protein